MCLGVHVCGSRTGLGSRLEEEEGEGEGEGDELEMDEKVEQDSKR